MAPTGSVSIDLGSLEAEGQDFWKDSWEFRLVEGFGSEMSQIKDAGQCI